VVYLHCSRVVTEIGAVETSVQPFVKRTQGLLRISAPNAFGRLHVVPVLKDYLKLYPDVSIELTLSDRVVDLVEERLDVAISSYPLVHSNLIRRVLLPLRWIVCCTPTYKKQLARKLVTPKDLDGHNCLYYNALAARDDIWTLSRGDEICKVSVRGSFSANNSEAVRDAALDGIGVALLPTFAIWHEVESGRLVRLLPEWTARGNFGDSLTAYFIADRHLTPKIRTLIDFLAKRFSRTPAWDSVSSQNASERKPRRKKTKA
jgi:DNA-binding transcriptional LysR family regulator